MHLKALTLQNFRRYCDRTVISIGKLTAFIGRGDEGKSTILEALDIFFEGGAVKIDAADACVFGDRTDVRIGAILTDLPQTLDLDRGARTTLQDEYLTSSDGDLEIIKVFNCSVQRIVPKVYASALHPNATGVDDLLQLTNAALKRLVKRADVESNCRLNNNPSMRMALYNAATDLELVQKEVPLIKADGKNIWNAIKQSLPVYALFRSDRVSSDQDPEVQNPMKLAIRSALARLNDDLEGITRKVEKAAEETAQRTLDQLRQSYPDLELASVLRPSFRKPNWPTVFKLELESDDEIPLNKRGSGVRRLVLLSFFQAEAVRKREEHQEDLENRVPVIYAVEEPETSQHPDSQERVIRAFREVADAGDQVLLTTHVPGLASLLPLPSLRFVDTDPSSECVRVREGSREVFCEVARTLGVLPRPSEKPEAKVAVAVEGPTDIDALESLAMVLKDSGDLSDLDLDKVFWTIGGGETLQAWVERRYLDRIGIPQVFLFDSDRKCFRDSPPEKTTELADRVRVCPNCQSFITRKRAIENYVHPAAIDRLSSGKISLPEGLNLDYDNVARAFKKAFDNAKRDYRNELGFYPHDRKGRQLGLKSGISRCKRILAVYVMRHMTADEIWDRSKYVGEDGIERNEIMDWLIAIRDRL